MKIKVILEKIYQWQTPPNENTELTEKRELINKYAFGVILACMVISSLYIPIDYWRGVFTTVAISSIFLSVFIIPLLTRSVEILKISFILLSTFAIMYVSCITGEENHFHYALIIIFFLTTFLQNREEKIFPIVSFLSPILAYIILQITDYQIFKHEIYTPTQAVYVKHIVFIAASLISATLVYFLQTSFKQTMDNVSETKNNLEKLVEERTRQISDNQQELTRMFMELSMKNKRMAELQEKLFVTQREQQKFVDIVENSLDLIALTQIDGSLLYINKAGRKMIGISAKEEFQSSRPWDISSDTYRHQLVDKIIPYIAEYGNWHGEIQLKNQTTQTIIDTDATFFILRDKKTKKSISIATIQRDITGKKETENNLKNLQSSLVQSDKMASLGVVSAGIAHEINNPINFVYAGVNTLIELMADLKELALKYTDKRSIEDNNNIGEIFTDIDILSYNIRDGALRTIEIVKSLKIFARTDADKFQTTNVNSLLNAVLVILKPNMRNILLHKEYDPNMKSIACYAGELNQVFMNIISNAIQAMNEKGDLFIRTKYINRYIKIYIKDTGIGMSEEVRKKVFEPFFTTKNVGDGLGLGMSISYSVIQKHNGNIKVKSEIGKGSEFVITLPV